MAAYTTRLEKSGRIRIPAAIRRQLKLAEGSPVLVKVDPEGTLHITSRAQTLDKVRSEIRKYVPAGEDLVDELIRDRRSAAERRWLDLNGLVFQDATIRVELIR